MGNYYTAGVFTFTATRSEIKRCGSISGVGMRKNWETLSIHYKSSVSYKSSVRYKYRIINGGDA
jgi:hypothetical protein